MQNVLGIASVIGLCGIFIGAPSWMSGGAIPAPFEVKPGVMAQLVDLDRTDAVNICIDAAETPGGVTVNYDGNEGALNQGDCLRVQARSVAIRAADDVPKGTVVTGVYALD